jgi:hypothetical protein
VRFGLLQPHQPDGCHLRAQEHVPTDHLTGQLVGVHGARRAVAHDSAFPHDGHDVGGGKYLVELVTDEDHRTSLVAHDLTQDAK